MSQNQVHSFPKNFHFVKFIMKTIKIEKPSSLKKIQSKTSTSESSLNCLKFMKYFFGILSMSTIS